MRAAPGGLAAILSYFARHATLANLLLVILLALGILSFPKLRAQFFPDVVVNAIEVSVAWEGAGAEDIDAGVIQLLEPALIAVEGVEETTAVSREGRGYVTVDFEPGWDMTRALDEVETAVDGVDTLPEAAEEPTIRRRAWRDRVTDVVITGPVDIDQLGRFADELSTRLFAVGVTRVTIRGADAPETSVEVPAINLIRHDITLREIANAIGDEVDTNPAGDVAGDARVRTGVAKRAPDDIAEIVLRTGDDGDQLTVGDVAEIRIRGIDRDSGYFVGEDPAILVRIDRSDRGDAIDIQSRVEEVADELEPSLPEGVTIDLIRTRSEAITQRLAILLENGLLGLGLVVILLFLFLNARIAFWVAAGIPVAMTAAIALMYAFGFTLNMISLFALIITLGIVVDDAIVVGEHADFRARRLGESPVNAAENAAIRMFTPVFSATLTTIIAFFGLIAIGGRFGTLIADIPFTVIVVLAASLIECFLILPNHMAHALTHTAKEHWYDWPSRQVNKGFRWVRDRFFRPAMAWVIRLRYPVLAATILALASQSALFIRGDVPWRFFNAPERGTISGNFAMLPSATREDTYEMMRRLQASVDELGRAYEEETGVNPVTYALAQIGGTTGRGLSGQASKDPDQLGSIAVELIDPDLRDFSSWDFVARLQDSAARHPKLETLAFRGQRDGPGGDSIAVKIFGADAEDLKAAAEALKTELAVYPEVSALEDTLAYDKDELILELTPRGQAMGYTIEEVGAVLRDRLNGIEAASYPDGTRSIEIRVELPDGEIRADFLERTLLPSPEGAYVPLADIVTVDMRTGFSTVRRENGVRVVTVSGDLSEDDPARATAIQTEIEERILPQINERFSVATDAAGLSEDENQFLADAQRGLILCLLGIYLVLAWIFASWTRPVVVMAIIPFGIVGAVWGHYTWDLPFSMFSVVGLIGMVGIIINDSIVLVSTIDEKAETQGLIPAIIDGASDRLRPVLLTTLTTVLGLTPLLYEGSQQAQFLKPTVITLVYGLGFGMVLVLLVVPALIAIQQDVGQAARALRRAFRRRHTGLALNLFGLAATMAVVFALTLGARIATGALPTAVAALLPEAAAGSLLAAFGLFVAGSLLATVLALVAFSIGARGARNA
ncbi:MAG: efflux RND transporter permease subunit [Pseudomonadota bacterium]